MTVEKIIFDSIDELNQQLNDADKLEKSPETILFGAGSKLDSLGLVNIITIVEQNLEDELDIAIELASERAMSQRRSPFKSVSTLTEYVLELIKEQKDVR